MKLTDEQLVEALLENDHHDEAKSIATRALAATGERGTPQPPPAAPPAPTDMNSLLRRAAGR